MGGEIALGIASTAMAAVQERIISSHDYADTVRASAVEAMNNLVSQFEIESASSAEDWLTDEFFDIGTAGLDGLTLTVPVADDINLPEFTEPTTTIPAIPEMDDINIVVGDVPSFTGSMPSIYIPDLPDDDFPVFTEDAPALSDIQLPDKPDYTLPPIPTVDDVSIPSPPEYSTPSFEGVEPTADLTPPTEMFVYNEAEYDSALKNKLADELYDKLIAGGTGLDADAEQAIWDRATARQNDENDKAYQEALNFHAARGFSLPEGVLNGTLVEANHRINQRKDDLNNDILVKQAELAQTNTHFIITQGIELEKTLMANANEVQNRAFEAAKATVQMANEIYRIKLEQYQAQLEGYKVKAQVYETKIRAETAKAEFYKSQIDGIRAGVEVKGLMISAYNAQVEGIKSIIQMYATEMEAAKVQSEIDNTRLEGFKTKAQVFGIETDALTSRYNAYQARIAGESEKVKMYTAEAEAYTARVNGYRAAAEVENSKAQIKLTKHQGEIETFKAAIEQYKAESDRLIAKAQAEASIEGVKIEKYKADVGRYEADVDAIVRNYLGKVESAKAEADALVREKEANIQKLLGDKGLAVEAIIAQSKIAGQLAAAALTSISASSSIGASGGGSANYGESKDLSKGTKTNSESHNYQYYGN